MAEADDSEINEIRLLSWNIDGLTEDGILERTLVVIDIINKHSPEVVFLQEVLTETLELIRDQCPSYKCFEAKDEGYFTIVMVKRENVFVKESKVIPFTNSTMGRDLQKIECTVKQVPCLLMTSHLESTKNCSEERKHQLKRALHHLVNAKQDLTVIFGGDLNLRDKELKDISGLPNGVFDVWEATGSNKDVEFTWDMSVNTNLDWEGKFKPKLRFDRIFVRHSKLKPMLKPVNFNLIGKDKIPECELFPSDHWGLLTRFEILSDS